MSYLLDTNAYYLFYQYPYGLPYHNLKARTERGGEVDFYISMLTSLEIHSVIGKAFRGSSPQVIQCERTDHGEVLSPCSHKWYHPGVTKLNRKLLVDIRKLVKQVENATGNVKAHVLALNEDIINEGNKILYNYATEHTFGSQDAIIAATAKIALSNGTITRVATSDRGLKAVLRKENIPIYDPLKDTEE
jgi:hypothetical protein